MTDRPASLIILGKTRITQDENDALETFGYCMALLEQELLTMPAKGAATAVLHGYLEGGGTPRQLERGQLPHDDVVVFLDDALEKALDAKMPDWVNRDWLIVDNGKIDEFTSIYLALMDTMDIDFGQ